MNYRTGGACCLLAAVFLLFETVQASGNGTCLSWEQEFNGKCYSLSRFTASWPSAVIYCESQGRRLAVVDSATTQSDIESYLQAESETSQVWIGGTDYVKDDDWTWNDYSGNFVDYTNWASGEPNGGTSEHCTLMNNNPFDWVDIPCGNQWKFVCQSA